MQAVILAGGLATRLKEKTRNTPKALLPIAGKPFVAYQLEWLARHGIRKVLFCLGHFAERIADTIQSIPSPLLRMEFSYETTLLGTGGALKNAEALLEENFFVLNGDSYLPIDPAPPIRAFLASGHLGMLTVFRNDNRYDESNVAIENGLVADYRRGATASPFQYIDYGIQFFRHEALQLLPAGTVIDMGVLYRRLIEKSRLGAFEVQTPFYEIGSEEGLRRFERFVAEKGLLQ